jgi:hypothetical protein
MAVENIRRHSKSPKKKVRAWVEANFPSDTRDPFALGTPMAVLRLILAGVGHFVQ